MKIACLGWGSLIWDPRDLPVLSPWFNDGPLLPIEFARQSQDDRITLVITPGFPYVRTLWALMNVENIDDARLRLAEREKIPSRNISKSIGYWSKTDNPSIEFVEDIGKWAVRMDLDAVVWTSLPPKFHGDPNVVPTVDDVIAFLKNLTPETKGAAEKYVRRAPAQVNTKYRRRIERELGWTPIT